MATSISTDLFASGFVSLIAQFKANAISNTAFADQLSDLFDNWDGVTPTELATSVSTFVASQRTWQKELRDWWAGGPTDGPFNNGMFPFTNDVGVTSYAPSPALLQNPVIGPAGWANAAAVTAQTAANTAVTAAAGINANTALIAQHVAWAQANSTIATTQAGYSVANATAANSSKVAAAASEANALSYRNTAQTYMTQAQSNATIATTQAGFSTANAVIATTQAGFALSNATLSVTQAGFAASNAASAFANATSANNSKNAAAGSEANALTYRTAAQTAMTQAQSNATIATGAATTAQANAVIATAQAGIATSNATAASGSASTATLQAGFAASNATIATTQAAISASNAVLAAASNSAAWTARSGALLSEANALAYRNTTLTYRDDAATSATNAAAANTNAFVFSNTATNRALAAEAAQTISETKAQEARNYANAAANSAAVAAAVSNAASYQLRLEKGQANGYAGLDANGKVPASQLDASLLGALIYQGTWNASTNSPSIPAASTSNKGQYYKVATAGTTNVSGVTDWQVGDMLVSNGSTWDKIDNTESVTSVAGRTGAITLTATDVGLGNVTNTSDANKPVSTAQQTALNLKLDIASKATVTEAVVGTEDTHYMTPSKTSAAITNAVIAQTQVTGLSTTFSGKLDVTARGVANGVASLDATGKLPNAQLPSHTHVISDVTNLQTSLDAKMSIGNAVTSVAGRIGAVTLSKSDVGLSNIDNTSDLNKPISTATQAALDLKVNTSTAVTSVASRTGAVVLTKSDVGLSNVDNTSDTSKPISTATQTALNAKLADGDLVKADRMQIVTPTISGGALTLDLSQGSVFNVSWNANITSISVTNCPTGAVSFTLVLTGAGGTSITWPTSVFKFPGGTAPTLISTTGAMNFLSMVTLNQAARVNVFMSGATI